MFWKSEETKPFSLLALILRNIHAEPNPGTGNIFDKYISPPITHNISQGNLEFLSKLKNVYMT